MKTPKPKQWAEQEIRQLIKLARQGAGMSKIAAETHALLRRLAAPIFQ
jgi:hypothetical protein